MDDFVPVSKRTRLPLYLSYLKRLQEEGTQFVSAVNLGEVFKLPPTLVKKDLSITGLQGVPKVGHKVTDLIAGIEHCLGWDNVSDAFLVGMGNLGRLLLTKKAAFKSPHCSTMTKKSSEPSFGTWRFSMSPSFPTWQSA